MSKTITKEIRVHIRDQKAWVEYETKTGSISKIDVPDKSVAFELACSLANKVERWLDDVEADKEK
jgi:hypothetical protein